MADAGGGVVEEGVGGYVLAGGKSSRMGQDKARLELGGRALVELAVEKLGQVCEAVRILSGDAELERYGARVGDLHPGCGPMSGVEAALEHSEFEWNLIMPVDVPFLPVEVLEWWVRGRAEYGGISMFTAGGMVQPAVVLMRRPVAEFVKRAMAAERYRLKPVLEEAGRELGSRIFAVEDVLADGSWPIEVRQRWFANLNTPEEFAEAERFAFEG